MRDMLHFCSASANQRTHAIMHSDQMHAVCCVFTQADVLLLGDPQVSTNAKLAVQQHMLSSYAVLQAS
jgi:hypothetical protein